jgi:hypothetical protein
VLQCQLKGHENWVRAVQFARVVEAAPGLPGGQRVSLLLASAAQDRWVLVHCITIQRLCNCAVCCCVWCTVCCILASSSVLARHPPVCVCVMAC